MMVSSNTCASFIAANYSIRRKNCRVTELDTCKTSVITPCALRVSLASNQFIADHEWRLPGGNSSPRTSGIGRLPPDGVLQTGHCGLPKSIHPLEESSRVRRRCATEQCRGHLYYVCDSVAHRPMVNR